MRSWLDTNIWVTIPLGFLLCYLLYSFQSWLVKKGELKLLLLFSPSSACFVAKS